MVEDIFFRVEQEDIHRAAHVDAVSVEEAIKVMRSSFSDREEVITFRIPISMRCDFEAFFREVCEKEGARSSCSNSSGGRR